MPLLQARHYHYLGTYIEMFVSFYFVLVFFWLFCYELKLFKNKSKLTTKVSDRQRLIIPKVMAIFSKKRTMLSFFTLICGPKDVKFDTAVPK